ncbi:hypothetical protein PSHT_02722, partial [Puccinia striiformis]
MKTNGQFKQVSKNSGQEVIINVTQDLDDNNKKVVGQKPKELLVNKDGFDHPQVYFLPLGKGPNQEKYLTLLPGIWGQS